MKGKRTRETKKKEKKKGGGGGSCVENERKFHSSALVAATNFNLVVQYMYTCIDETYFSSVYF